VLALRQEQLRELPQVPQMNLRAQAFAQQL